MRHHYWKWPIPTYLFLGGLGGGIYCLIMCLTLFVYPGIDIVPEVMAWPGFISILALGFGCLMLVADLGQPMVFYRAFVKSTSVLAWGARLLTVCMFFGLFWFVSYIPWDWFSPIATFFVPFRAFNIAVAGIAGTCIMLYTGIFLSTLKAHAFWATPALPVLFTVSALSTACAAITLSVGWWPASFDATSIVSAAVFVSAVEACHHIVHTVDVILVICELIVLFVMVLSFLGAGNKTANKVAHKWIHGSYALYFWVGMIGIGLVIPELLYIFVPGIASSVIAPIFVLCGGLLLRFMVVNSDERAPLPGEERYYTRLAPDDSLFIHKWTYGDNLF